MLKTETIREFYNQAHSLLEAETVLEMKEAARELRRTAITVRRHLMLPVLGTSFIQIAPSVLDPEQRRRQRPTERERVLL
jgi:hypothetical protein